MQHELWTHTILQFCYDISFAIIAVSTAYETQPVIVSLNEFRFSFLFSTSLQLRVNFPVKLNQFSFYLHSSSHRRHSIIEMAFVVGPLDFFNSRKKCLPIAMNQTSVKFVENVWRLITLADLKQFKCHKLCLRCKKGDAPRTQNTVCNIGRSSSNRNGCATNMEIVFDYGIVRAVD